MNAAILHLKGPSRQTNCAAIAGNRTALERLRDALSDALASGSGGTGAYQADGEFIQLAIVLAEDMHAVHVDYMEDEEPKRSGRERIPISGLRHFAAAVQKAGVVANFEDEQIRRLRKAANP